MPITQEQADAALARLDAYNTEDYDADTNPGGFGNDGHTDNIEPMWADMVVVGQFAGERAAAADTAADAAAGSAGDAADAYEAIQAYHTATVVPAAEAAVAAATTAGEARDAAIAAVGAVRVSAADTTPGTLATKIEVVAGELAAAVTGGGDQRLQLSLPPIAGVAGTYTAPTLTIDSKGRVVAAANGSAGSTGGASLALTVSEAVTAGDRIAMRADGVVEKVKKTGGSGGTTTTLKSTPNDGDGDTCSLVYVSSVDRFVMFYTYYDNVAGAYKFAWELWSDASGGTRIAGPNAVTVSTARPPYIGAGYDPVTDRVVVAYTDAADAAGTWAHVVTVTATAVIWGAANELSASYGQPSLCWHAGINRLVMAVKDAGGTNNLVIAVLAINTGASTVSVAGSGTLAGANVWYRLKLIYEPSAERVVALWYQLTTAKAMMAVASCTTSSASIGAAAEVHGAPTDTGNYNHAHGPLSGNRLIVVYGKAFSTDAGPYAKIGTINAASNTVEFGTEHTLRPGSPGGSWMPNYVGTSTVDDSFLVTYSNASGYATALAGALVAGVPTYSSSYVYRSASCFTRGGVALPDNYHAVISSSAHTEMAVTLIAAESTNSDLWIGEAKETTAEDQPCAIALRGNLATHLGGLTPGATYHLGMDGALNTTGTGPRYGRALTPTTILLEAP